MNNQTNYCIRAYWDKYTSIVLCDKYVSRPYLFKTLEEANRHITAVHPKVGASRYCIRRYAGFPANVV